MIHRAADGTFVLDFEPEERDFLRSLPDQLRSLLLRDDPGVARLFPPAYREDPEREEEYQRLMRDDLLAKRLDALAVVEETIDRDHLDEEQALAWVGVLNDVRLVLGTSLDVTEDMDYEGLDPDDPRSGGLAMYSYLSWLVESFVGALSGTEPDTT